MSVLTPVVESWDGENRRIYLKSDVSDYYPIDDIYKEYRNERRLNEDFRKWEPLLKAEGNVPKGGGAYTPRYVVLLDGTKIVPYDNTVQINQLGDMITDDADNDSELYDISTLTVPKVVYIKPSESETIQLNSEAIVYSSYQNSVWVDVDSIYSDIGSSTEPNGNRERPVNNVSLAVSIAKTRGFNTLSLLSDVTLGAGDNIEGFNIRGQNSTLTHLVILDEAMTFRCEITNCHVTGILDGETTIIDCDIEDLNYINGQIHHSLITGTITLGGGSSASIHGCFSGVPGISTPTIDFGGSGNSLSLRAYSGGIKLTNKTGSDSASIDMDSGQIKIGTDVTNGLIVCRGVGEITERLDPQTATIIDQMLNSNNITEATWSYER